MEKRREASLGWAPRACAAGLGGVVLLLFLSLLASIWVLHSSWAEEREGLLVRVALFAAAGAAAFVSTGGARETRLAGTVLSGGILLVFVFLLGLVSEDSSVINISFFLDLICIVGAIILALFARRGAGKRRRRRR